MVRLGGVSIPAGMELQGYSDGDAAVHAVIDALLGAAGAGDIGQRFPPGEPRWRGANSLDLLATAWGELAGRGFLLGNVDVTIQAELPRLSPHYAAMRERIAAALSCRPGAISIKATTMEGLGAIGHGEGIAALAVATLFGPVDG
jgi:2-C-methyl-D-erythritol 2,4-cyclodiphosphate synthase